MGFYTAAIKGSYGSPSFANLTDDEKKAIVYPTLESYISSIPGDTQSAYSDSAIAIHLKPSMYIYGTIKDSGEYNLTFKAYANSSRIFGYRLKIFLNSTEIFSFSRTDIKTAAVTKTATGTESYSSSGNMTLRMVCEACSGNGVASSNCEIKTDTYDITDTTYGTVTFSSHIWVIKKCTAPTLTLTSGSSTTSSVSFTPSVTNGLNNGKGVFTGSSAGKYYQYCYKKSTDSSYGSWTYASSNSGSISISGLDAGSTYNIQCRYYYYDTSMSAYNAAAVNNTRNGLLGNTTTSTQNLYVTKSISLTTSTNPASDLEVYVTNTTGKTVEVGVYWVAGNETGKTATVKICTSNSPTATAVATKTGLSSGSSYTFTGLTKNTTYYVFAMVPGTTNLSSYSASVTDYTKTYNTTISIPSANITTNGFSSATLDSNNAYSISASKIKWWITESTSTGTIVKAKADTTTAAVSATGLKPNTTYYLHAYLTGIDEDTESTASFKTLASATCTASVTGATGTTIVVTLTPTLNGSTSIKGRINVRAGTSATGTVTSYSDFSEVTATKAIRITGLTKGTSYTVTFNTNASSSGSPADNNGNTLTITQTTARTYGTTATAPSTIKTNSFSTGKVTYTSGQGGGTDINSDKAKAVQWAIYNSDGTTIVKDWATVDCSSTNPQSFNSGTGILIPSGSANSTYRLYTRVNGIEYPSGTNDTLHYVSFTMKKPAIDLTATTDAANDATGTTLCIHPSWTASTSSGNTTTVTITLSNTTSIVETKTTTTSGSAIWFTGLPNGNNTYTFSVTASDVEGNTTNDYILYKSGFTGTKTNKTYYIAIRDVTVSTRSVQFTVAANKDLPSDKKIEYGITQTGNTNTLPVLGNSSYRMDRNEVVNFTSLLHNTSFTITARIQDMKDQSSNYDTVVSTNSKTLQLILQFVSFVAHVHSIETTWQAKTGNDNYDKDPISNTNISFVASGCSIVPVITGKGATGTNSGTYSTNKTRTFFGLTGGREYTMTVTITDGINQVSATTTQWALVQLIRIFTESDGKWHTCLPYIYNNGVWYRAPCYIYNNGEWKDSDPERN